MNFHRHSTVVLLATLPLSLVSLASLGCNGAAKAVGSATTPLLAPPPIARDAGESTLAPLRASCAFDAGAWPGQTIGNDYPVGTDIPINHVIVITQENRSFDHYLGHMVAEGYYDAGDFTVAEDGAVGAGFADNGALDGPPPGWALPDVDGGMVPPHPDDEYCYGVNHDWADQHFNWDQGKNDNFVIDNYPDGQRTMFYEDDTVIPFYHLMASTFSVGDRYYCSVISSTWPNRFFLMAATSFGIGDNSQCVGVDTLAHPAPQIFNLLEEGGHTWKDYTDGPHMEFFFPVFGSLKSTAEHYGNIDCDLMSDIANNTLPDVSFVMGDEITESSDEGPSDLPGIGGQVVETIIRNLMASPAWADTAIFINYDENGGLADHVPPAAACAPDDYTPHLGDGTVLDAGFDTTGFRVPFIVISPYAKAHYVSHVVHDHTSVTRFIEARFGLPALTRRDANSLPPMEMFDFQNPPFMTPPTLPPGPMTTVDAGILALCNQTMAPLTCTR